MKTLRLAAIAAVCALACALALAGCGQSGQSVTKESLAGNWSADPDAKLQIDAYLSLSTAEEAAGAAAESDESSSAASDSASSASASASSASAAAEGAGENIATLIVGGTYYEGTWTVEGGKATVTLQGNSGFEIDEETGEMVLAEGEAMGPISLTMKNNKLYLGDSEGTQLVFVAASEEDNMAGANQAYVDPVIDKVEETTIADDDKVTIKVTGKGTDYTGDPCYQLSIVNKTDKAIYVTTSDESMFKVDGAEVSAGLGESVDAGETYEEGDLYFPAAELTGGVDALKNVEGTIIVEDDESGDEIATYEFKM